MLFVIDKSKSQEDASVSEDSLYSTEVQWDISALMSKESFMQIKYLCVS